MKRIFLIGYMGAGKTTIGKDLASLLGLSFIDLDWYIEERYHKKISDFFEAEGEAGFRQIERKMLKEVSQFENILVATGGGTPCFFDNMDYMNLVGKTIYLKVTEEELADRLEVAKASRPLIADKNREELIHFIANTINKREPFYLRSQIVFKAETMNTKDEIQKIISQLASMLL
ncbi:MAG: shikimate kinase [Tannerellaceae bacterium]